MEITRSTDTFTHFEKNYWDYYRELENDFLLLRKYISICKDNFNTYSIEILKLYQAVCSEIDVLGKAMAKLHNAKFKPEDKKNNILKWWFEIQDSFLVTEPPFSYNNQTALPKRIGLREYQCRLFDSIILQPWRAFTTEESDSKRKIFRNAKGSQTPSWWSDYNKVKHTRTSLIPEEKDKTNYSKANLGNLCNSFAALYIIEKAVIDSVGTKDDLDRFLDHSRLFVKPSRYSMAEMDKLASVTFV